MASPSNDDYLELIELLVHSTPSKEHKKLLDWVIATQAQLQQPLQRPQFLDLLASIPVLPDASCLPLALLSFILARHQGSVPSFDIIRCYTKLWLALPEVSKAGQDEDSTVILQEAHNQLCLSIGTIASHFTNATTRALIDPESHRSLTHQQLSTFITSFALPLNISSNASKPRVAIALPLGYLLALACLAVSSYYTAAPLNIAGGPSQLRSDVELAGAQYILVLATDVERLGLHEPWVAEAGILILVALPQEDMMFGIQPLSTSSPNTATPPPTPNTANDLALILFTSGTSGTKKVVPITCLSLLTGVQCVVDSWGLTPSDTCINMLPLNHVGGLVRNLFAPVISGGAVILCPAFDPASRLLLTPFWYTDSKMWGEQNLFWDLLESGQGTWYYASPSMHMSILAEAGLRGEVVSKRKLRLVCNAAGGLLPALATRLRDTFECTVFPSYGMTECMPISTPPLGYTLDRVGASGIGCGPEIAILDDLDKRLGAGEVGRINVRGGPTFPGYLKDGEMDRSAFNKDGFFDTGDLGSLDEDGYLYLTGRGKEVINRGGEIISPFEVEEAITIASQDSRSPLFERVRQVLAFSAPHEMLQEVVGVALLTPPNAHRVDIRELQTALNSSLHSTKWPVVLVYMDALPMSNNKLVRIKFAERMDMRTITNEMTLPERHFEASCPPLNSLLSTKISNSTCILDLPLLLSQTQRFMGPEIEAHVGINHHGMPVVYLARSKASKGENPDENRIEKLDAKLRGELDGLLVPSSIIFLPQPFPRHSNGAVDEVALDDILKALKHAQAAPAASETEQKIRKAFAEVLNFPIDEIVSESDFFSLGGESLSAGHLLSLLRRNLGVRIPVDQLFTSSKISSLCSLVDAILATSEMQSSKAPPTPGCTKTYSSTNPLVLFIHALPIMLFYPMKMAFQWTALMYALSTLSRYWDESNVAARFLALVASMFASRLSTQIAAPLFGILFKWVVIGRYREGIYPMWGPYHCKWWLADKVLRICGKGVFRHLNTTHIIYLRLLGANIGTDVTIEPGTTLGEYDLLTIGDNVHLDRCICRPFAAERNTSMYLGSINIGSGSSVGLKSYIAAGSILPPDTFIGANSSSYEVGDYDTSDRRRSPTPNPWLQLFCIMPIQVLVMFVSSLPWMGGLFGIVMNEPLKSVDSVKTVIIWWATPHRISFHYFAQALNVSVRPFVWFALLVVIKCLLNIFCGRATPRTVEDRTQGDRFRSQLLNALAPHGSLVSLTKLFGSHYEVTSMAVRAMGGKVGRRVYWPGTGPTIEDFDLLDIGDDVVFGSRSHIITSDAKGSDVVRIGSGTMVADRVVLSPGVEVGERTVLGSGAFLKRYQRCVPDSVWIGNRHGTAICLSSSSSSTMLGSIGKGDDPEKDVILSYAGSPHGTSIFSPPPSYTGPLKSPNVSAAKFFEDAIDDKSNTRLLLRTQNDHHPRLLAEHSTTAKHHITSSTNSLFFSTRHPSPSSSSCSGTLLLYPQSSSHKSSNAIDDKSNIVLERCYYIHNHPLTNHQILGMLTGSHFIVIYFRLMGARIGKDCALFAGGRPSLVFTEPDLLTLGNRVSVDDASLVGHVNSRGKFSLNRLEVGDRSVLRSGSRLLSGARMGSDCILLEHTLIMAGDEADDGHVYQGWPADAFSGDRLRGISAGA
ncbi:related to coenzyme a synthetase [Phialocephala subalpina]|uniref:Related to coenzyme a synthetase n=1 Tax=Phialocephala subalpina TaxID=576137 RepID=A0A1L7XBR9_9HELO|nr:related to coenzyme a synthetase [Phialocephala subalpina]